MPNWSDHVNPSAGTIPAILLHLLNQRSAGATCFQRQHISQTQTELFCVCYQHNNQLHWHPHSHANTLSTRSWKDKGTKPTSLSLSRRASVPLQQLLTHLFIPGKLKSLFASCYSWPTHCSQAYSARKGPISKSRRFFYCIHNVQTQLSLIRTCLHFTICTELQRWNFNGSLTPVWCISCQALQRKLREGRIEHKNQHVAY